MIYKRNFVYRFFLIIFCSVLFLLVVYHSVYSNSYNYLNIKQKSIIRKENRPVINCVDTPKKTSIQERGEYMVYYNIVPARRSFHCHESITLTTIAEYNFLDNIVTLAERWRGPISVAVYAPGEDFQVAVDAIAYYRQCVNEIVQELVSFHLFHDRDHYPKLKTSILHLLQRHPALSGSSFNCSSFHPTALKSTNTTPHHTTYRNKQGLKFPVNVARNIARLSADTYYVFASDIELYPSLNIIPNFFKLLESAITWRTPSVVFSMPVFEVEAAAKVPNTKNELLQMYEDKKAIFFHEHFCKNCHGIPRKNEWLSTKADEDGTLSAFARVKRQKKFQLWEPMYIGTQAEPLYDERMFFEGGSDKMVQGYALCLLDYDIVLLDNAFLVHKPGIKLNSSRKPEAITESRKIMIEHIEPEMNILYGKRNGCVMYY